MEVFALFSDKTAEKILLDSFPARETETGLILKTTISSSELKESAVTSINNAYILLERLFDYLPERIGVCVYGFSSNVTGNSADIAFALAFISHLAKKGVIKPVKPLPLSVAATGVISERLSIEPVGHIREKILAAARNKIEIVLYPFGNQVEIEELKKNDAEFAAILDKINLIPIKSLEDIFYEFGFLKARPDMTEEKNPGRKLPTALIIASVVFLLLVAAMFSVVYSGIFKKSYTSLKSTATPETIMDSPTPMPSKTGSVSVSSFESVKSPVVTDNMPTPFFTATGEPVITPKPSPNVVAAVEKQIPTAKMISSSGETIKTAGNISANMMNSGFVASKGDWIFYTDHINLGLYRMKNDGSGVNRLQNAFASHINVSGDSIYYLDKRSRGLFRIKTDGSDKRKINDDDFGMISVLGDWVYYLNRNDDRLYKVNKNGLDRTPLCNEFLTGSENLSDAGISCSHLCVGNNYVYFQAEFKNKPDENGIYRMKTNGSDKQIITRDKCDMLCVEDDYIYFAASDDGSLYRVRANGNGKERIYGKVKAFNIASGLIYFSTGDGLFKMNFDGDFISKLTNDPTNKINITSDWIYYFNSKDANRLYRVRPNGVDRQSIG